MKVVVMPMRDDLAAAARCCSCHQDFTQDDHYALVTTDEFDAVVRVWFTCLGCAAQLACSA